MKNDDLYMNPTPVDNITPYGKGLEPDIDPTTNFGKGLEPKVDNITPYGKGLEPDIDPITNFGKGITYMSCDGKEFATIEEVMQYNQIYYNNLINNKAKDIQR